MRDLEIGDLSLIMRRIFGLPDDADARVTERLKHMRKLGFPTAAKVGQGYRRTYGVDEVLKVAVAFQLIDVGLASAMTVKLAIRHWPLVAEGLTHAIAGGDSQLGLTPNVVTDLSKVAAKAWDGGTCAVSHTTRQQAPSRASTSRQPGTVPSPVIAIDLGLLVRSAKRALGSLEGVASDEVEAALRAFRPAKARDGT